MNVKPVELTMGNGGLPKLCITTPSSAAEIYLQGAHLTHFQKQGEPPLLFMSTQSWFAAGKAIRGGVPICFPWFGNRAGGASHGFARTTSWELADTRVATNGSVTVRLKLPVTALAPEWAGLRAEFAVTVGETLTMELTARNESPVTPLVIENCLHTYFRVGDIGAVSLTGLGGATFLDNAAGGNGERKVQAEPELRLMKETNRIYLDTASAVEIRDEQLRRTIRVEKSGSRSTVVWNPWTTQKLPEDFNAAEHRQMVCVESGNVNENKITLAAGASVTLRAAISSRAD
ncbi:MAG: putative glucose-6-phosphate 1-epimerase [Verrucomicrobiota bacterium]|jgi:D-hexose-6-phosphate mutarotase